MDTLATGFTQHTNATSFLFLSVDLKDFSLRLGGKPDSWMDSLKGSNPKLEFVQMMVYHTNIDLSGDPSLTIRKFTKFCSAFESYLKTSIYESFQDLIDEKTTLVDFWDQPEDHTKMKKPNEKIRNLSKLMFQNAYDKYVPKNLGDYYHTLELVTSLKAASGKDEFTVEVGNEAVKFTTKPYVTFIKLLAPLAKKYPYLYERKQFFKLHPNGTVIFDMDQFSDSSLQRMRQTEPTEELRRTLNSAQRILKELLDQEDFADASVLVEFSEHLSNLIKNHGRKSQSQEIKKLREFLHMFSDQSAISQIDLKSLYEYLVSNGPQEPDPVTVAQSVSGKYRASPVKKPSFIPAFAHNRNDFAHFFNEDSDEDVQQ